MTLSKLSILLVLMPDYQLCVSWINGAFFAVKIHNSECKTLIDFVVVEFLCRIEVILSECRQNVRILPFPQLYTSDKSIDKNQSHRNDCRNAT